MTSGTDETLQATPDGSSTAELHELSAGDSIGRYEIVGVLGAGGMGRVYRARDPDLNRELAIKVLRRAEGSGASSSLEHRLLREAQAMARLKHANLATVYDVGAVRGEVFIAFEFIDGKTLAAWMREPGRTTSEKLAALVAAGRGLEAAHSAGVIHRDFKPDNVLVAHDGEVKVVDFGLARGVDAAADGASTVPSTARNDALATDLTMTGSLLGTPAYMAPEQHKGLASDARADQFGFAVSAWEALYGERPFRGKNIETLATAICSGAIQPPPAGHDVAPHIEAALRRALSVDPAARFADMGELLTALTARPLLVRRPRRWWLAIGAGVAVVVGAGALYIAGHGTHAKPSEAATSRGERPRGRMQGPTPEVRARIAEGEADRTAIRAAIRRDIERVRECYEDASDVDETIGSGTVAIDFEIAADGHVRSTRIVSDDFHGKGGVAGCVAAKSFGWEFPALQGRGIVHVTYPFNFRREPEREDEDELPPPPAPPAPPGEP